MNGYRAMALAAILAVSSTARPAAALADDVKGGVDGEGYIVAWLILAPIPMESDQEGPAALAKEQVAEEARLRPEEGAKVEVDGKALAWRGVEAKEGALDFNEILGRETEHSVVYAVSYVVAEEAVEGATLKVGSDDQVRVYLDGRLIHSSDEARPHEKDQDSVEGITLRKGRNVLVLKVVNEGGDWGGSARFVDKDGAPIKGITATSKPE